MGKFRTLLSTQVSSAQDEVFLDLEWGSWMKQSASHGHEHPQAWLALALKTYGMRVRGFEPCQSAYTARAAYRVDTGNGHVVVKVFRQPLYRLQRMLRELQYLKKSGYRRMPKVLSNQSGQYWSECGKRLIYLTEWVDGPPVSLHSSDLMLLGRALAELHTVPVPVEKSRSSQMLTRMKQLENDFYQRNLPSVLSQHSPSQRWFQSHVGEIRELSESAWTALGREEIAPILEQSLQQGSYLHGDVTRPNVLRRRRDVCLIDWEQVKIGCPWLELVKAMANTTEFESRSLLALLRGYERIRPLSPAERRIVAALFHFPREAWLAALQIGSQRKNLATFQVLESTWEQRLEAVRAVDDWSQTVPFGRGP
jgi:Ser/Thr protein kinase RdoA (MazF antagonist)